MLSWNLQGQDTMRKGSYVKKTWKITAGYCCCPAEPALTAVTIIGCCHARCHSSAKQFDCVHNELIITKLLAAGTTQTAM
jgi:hypothetical protein